MRLPRLCPVLAVLASLAAGRSPAGDKEPTPAEAQFFEKQVRPLLAAHCHKCHGPQKQRGDLRLDSRPGLLEGGTSGPAIVPGKPKESLLIEAINYGRLKMPPSKRLSSKEVATLTQWVRMGAPWPGKIVSGRPPRKPGLTITDEDRKFWSFRPVVRPAVPGTPQRATGTPQRATGTPQRATGTPQRATGTPQRATGTPQRAFPTAATPIDAFLLRKLRARGLGFAPPATRRELIRRATFDLLGLPPTPEEIDAFVKDGRPDAYERLVDRLLASPAYGERWGRHWLDVVRFAQTNGYERDDEKPNSWRYRDYVIRAFNADLPYDRFVKEQLAGDELDDVTDDALTATAFYRLGVWDDEPDDKRQAEFDELDDMLSVTGSTFLGLTIGCARCHDHKFDPLAQEDYYGLLAFLRNIRPYTKPDKDLSRSIFRRLKAGGFTLAVRERGPVAPATHVLLRGSAGTPGKQVEPHFPRVLCAPSGRERPPWRSSEERHGGRSSEERHGGRSSEERHGGRSLPAVAPASRGQSTGRRRALAEWVARRDNPLTARVIVNRLWQHHFGKGLVATPSDFGHTGTRPTHPALLDWLAAELVDGGWRLKRLHRLIMLSDAYRQSSRVNNDRAVLADPGNTLLWRQDLRRLEAEAIRDAVLAVSGRLNRAMGGRGIFPTLPQEVLSTQSRPGLGWDKSSPEEQARRSVYIFVKRTLGVPLLETFDFASPDTPTAARAVTTIAPQALILLNSAFMDEQSAALAGRLMAEGGARPEANVERLFRLALGRGPTARERRVVLAYLERGRQAAKSGTDAHRHALARLCKVIFNLNEFVYID